MGKRIEFLEIIDKKRINNDFFLLELLSRSTLQDLKPGQFVQVKVDGSPETFLRRPLSIHDIDISRNSIKLLIQITGKGTETLSKLDTGDKLNLIYPLGNSFTLPSAGKKTLLIGGGCGIAPLLFLGKYLKSNGYTPDILLGFRNRERIIEFDDYKNIGNVFMTTEDGSVGEKGYVTDHQMLSTGEYDKVYCCGPMPMMRSVARYCKKKNFDCEVSIENLMGCGIGACLCCVVETVNGNRCTCIDGPVFNVNDLKW